MENNHGGMGSSKNGASQRPPAHVPFHSWSKNLLCARARFYQVFRSIIARAILSFSGTLEAIDLYVIATPCKMALDHV